MNLVKRQRGQALVMVTLALLAMCGMLGLGIDLGWSFYVHKTARAAADAGSLAAVKQALADVLTGPPYTCGQTGITCQANPIPCFVSNAINGTLAGTNLATGCLYAQQNGFQNDGHGNRQNLQISAGVGENDAAAPGVAAFYWVHLMAAETSPQLFSAALGNTEAIASTDSTAVIVDEITLGSLILLNRSGDIPAMSCGGNTAIDLCSSGGGPIDVPGGILLSSNCNGSNAAPCSGAYAGTLQGNTSVTSPFTYIRGAGTTFEGGNAKWTAPYTDGFGDISFFSDPESGKGQPPLSSSLGKSPNDYIPVPGGNLGTAQCPGKVCPAGIYYATTTIQNKPGTYASGQQITVPSGYTFGANDTSFNDYVFFGGLNVGASAVTFNPGRYVLAGVDPTGASPDVLISANKTQICGACDPSTGSGTGMMLILTDTSYGGDANMSRMVSNIPDPKESTAGVVWTHLNFGDTQLISGNNAQSSIKLTGPNPSDLLVQNAGLQDFAPIVIWQDQQNSTVMYDSKGNVMTTSTPGSCVAGGTLSTPCLRTLTNPNSPNMTLWAGQNNSYNGIVYQPRGSTMTIHSGSSTAGPIRIVTGSVNLQGSPGLSLTGTSNPITRLVAALAH